MNYDLFVLVGRDVARVFDRENDIENDFLIDIAGVRCHATRIAHPAAINWQIERQNERRSAFETYVANFCRKIRHWIANNPAFHHLFVPGQCFSFCFIR